MSKIFVFGHQNPDSDAIGSSYGYAYLKRQLGVEAEAVALVLQMKRLLLYLTIFL